MDAARCSLCLLRTPLTWALAAPSTHITVDALLYPVAQHQHVEGLAQDAHHHGFRLQRAALLHGRAPAKARPGDAVSPQGPPQLPKAPDPWSPPCEQAPWRAGGVEGRGGTTGWRPHLDQDGKEQAGAQLLHTLGCHAAVIAVVSLLLQGLGLHILKLPVAWAESGRGPTGGCCVCAVLGGVLGSMVPLARVRWGLGAPRRAGASLMPSLGGPRKGGLPR